MSDAILFLTELAVLASAIVGVGYVCFLVGRCFADFEAERQLDEDFRVEVREFIATRGNDDPFLEYRLNLADKAD